MSSAIELTDTTRGSIFDREPRITMQQDDETQRTHDVEKAPRTSTITQKGHDVEKSARASVVETSSFSSTYSSSSSDSDRSSDSPVIHPTQTIEGRELALIKSLLIMITVSSISFLNAFNSGLLTVGIRRIGTDLNIASSLLLWPSSIYALSLSCTLLLMGAIADIVGSRPVFVTGTIFFTIFTLALPLSQNGDELIAIRALQGIAMSCCLPTSVGIVTSTFAVGRMRNIAFAVVGGGWPIGFSVGLVLGGVFVETVGWRAGFYISAGMSALAALGAYYTIPMSVTLPNKRQALKHDIDWIGVLIASACLALLSYILSKLTASASIIHQPQNIVLLIVGLLLIPTFIFWVRRQEQLGLPAIIPNSIWKSGEFTSICITVFLMWAAFNAFGYWSTLLLQDIQGVSALGTSVRFLPLVIVSILSNIVAAALVEKVPAAAILLIGCALSAISPLLFATLNPKWTYWAAEFVAMSLSPVGSDLLFNIANLVVTASFPKGEQARAGGIFNTVAQLGNSFGVALSAMLAAGVTSVDSHKEIPIEATLKGYQSAFWMCFAASVVGCFTAALGLRHSGKVGLKRE